MHHAMAVGIVEGSGNRQQDLERDARLDRSVEQLVQRPALDQLHDHVGHIALEGEVVEADDGRVVERGHSSSLEQEAALETGVEDDVGAGGLDGREAAQQLVLAAEDDAHAAHAEDVQNDISTELPAKPLGAGTGTPSHVAHDARAGSFLRGPS